MLRRVWFLILSSGRSYIGAAILILCVIYTTMKVKEWNPQQYAEYNEAKREEGRVKNPNAEASEDKAGWITLLRKAPSTFWKVGLVQFFCGLVSFISGIILRGAIAETYGIRPILLLKHSRRQATGWHSFCRTGCR